MGDIVRPQSPAEASRIHQAPHGAVRKSKRELDVSWLGGTRKFRAKPPYDADLNGVWWAYCGYNKELGLHLIMEQDEDLFTGMLLDDKSGKLLPGGESVLFSPNQKLYLAFEQPDGQDGETIKLCKRDGTLIWRGWNGILNQDGITVAAEIENVHWNALNQLFASARSTDGGQIRDVELTKNSDGQWQWLQPTNR